MNVYVDQIFRPKYALIYTSLILVGVMTSCDRKGDPSYEKDALRLTAEKATVEANFKSAESQLTAAEATIASLKSELADLKEKPREPKAPKVDIDKIKLGLMSGVQKLRTSVESQQSKHSVESVTFGKMTIPTERPFSSAVVMTLKSKENGQVTKLSWLGQGSAQGEWVFGKPTVVDDNRGANDPHLAQDGKTKPIPDNTQNKPPKKIGTTQTVDKNGNRIIQIQFPEDGQTSGTPSTGQSGQPTTGTTAPPKKAPPTPQKPTPQKPQRPKQPMDPNTHKIDWDKLNR